ncbi:hypothetical protein NDU88_001463 [Pleurodeles waltl]|uniref:Uncharacterized protein n=1 Tax=Pleurodeles waltl TaxID=8319 RepID=A0AAV7SZA2_PLEWA|nr:hypothetical protein NDU88_001463 [Pleurodeles waltl]
MSSSDKSAEISTVARAAQSQWLARLVVRQKGREHRPQKWRCAEEKKTPKAKKSKALRSLLVHATQLPEVSVDTFYARLKDLARTRILPDADHEIQAQFFQGCLSIKLMENILQVPGMPLADILTMGQSKDLSEVRAAHMEAGLQHLKTEPVNTVAGVSTGNKKTRPNTSLKTCYGCGGS